MIVLNYELFHITPRYSFIPKALAYIYPLIKDIIAHTTSYAPVNLASLEKVNLFATYKLTAIQFRIISVLLQQFLMISLF